MRARPFTFFLSLISLVTVLNIIFVYDSTKNATSNFHTKQHGRILAKNHIEFRDANNAGLLWFPNETQDFNKIIRGNALKSNGDASVEFRQRGELNTSLNRNDMKYIPVGKNKSINLSFQDLFEQLVSNRSENNRLALPVEENDTFSTLDKQTSFTQNTSFSLNETYVTDLIKKTITWYYEIDKYKEYNHHCRRCALVTSSGRLLNQRVGADIESADCVIRMNDAPVIGFENDVGLRTDIRVIGHPNLVKLIKNPENILEMFYKNATRTKLLLVPWLYNATVNKTSDESYAILRNLTHMFPDVKFYVPSKKAMDAAEAIFEFEIGLKRSKVKTWFSTGWQTMLLAISICNMVTVYGMPQTSHCSNSSADSTPYHYYNKDGKRECDYYMRSERRLDTGHIFLTEKAVFSRWAHKFNITFRTPSWNVTSTGNGTLDTPFLRIFNRAQVRRDKIQLQRHVWRERINKRRERSNNTPTEEPLYFLLFSVSLLIVVLKGCDIVTFVVTAIVPQSWQDCVPVPVTYRYTRKT